MGAEEVQGVEQATRRVSRRTLLGATAAVAAASAAACGSSGSSSGHAAPTNSGSATSATTAPAPASDRDIALKALTDEQRVLAGYRALAQSLRRGLVRFAPLIAIQRRHVNALATALDVSEPLPQPAVAPPPLVVPDAAKRAARARLAECSRVESGSLASLLASMAASHAAVAAEWGAGE